MWYVIKNPGSPNENLLYSDNREWKARERFYKALEHASDKDLFHLIHTHTIIEKAHGGQNRLNPNVNPISIPPVYPQRKP